MAEKLNAAGFDAYVLEYRHAGTRYFLFGPLTPVRSHHYPEALEMRYKFVPMPEESGFDMLERAAAKRGFLISKGEYDIERMANTLMNEYHEGKLGRLSLEAPDD